MENVRAEADEIAQTKAIEATKRPKGLLGNKVLWNFGTPILSFIIFTNFMVQNAGLVSTAIPRSDGRANRDLVKHFWKELRLVGGKAKTGGFALGPCTEQTHGLISCLS